MPFKSPRSLLREFQLDAIERFTVGIHGGIIPRLHSMMPADHASASIDWFEAFPNEACRPVMTRMHHSCRNWSCWDRSIRCFRFPEFGAFPSPRRFPTSSFLWRTKPIESLIVRTSIFHLHRHQPRVDMMLRLYIVLSRVVSNGQLYSLISTRPKRDLWKYSNMVGGTQSTTLSWRQGQGQGQAIRPGESKTWPVILPLHRVAHVGKRPARSNAAGSPRQRRRTVRTTASTTVWNMR